MAALEDVTAAVTKSNISKYFWLQNTGNNFHHTVLANFNVSALDETQINSSHPAWESKQPTSRSESDSTWLEDPTAATLHIHWSSDWKNHRLDLILWLKWHKIYTQVLPLSSRFCADLFSLKQQKLSINKMQLVQAEVDTDTDKISDWCQRPLRNDKKHEASS